jgi:hypothetical protein
MTDERKPDVPNEDTYEIEHGLETHEIERGTDAPSDPDGTAEEPAKPEEPNPWLKEGADAPDAADIEDPTTQR